VLGVSAGYVNLLENNERSLSLRILMAVADSYGVDWRDLVSDKSSNSLAELRSVIKDPMFSTAPADCFLSLSTGRSSMLLGALPWRPVTLDLSATAY